MGGSRSAFARKGQRTWGRSPSGSAGAVTAWPPGTRRTWGWKTPWRGWWRPCLGKAPKGRDMAGEQAASGGGLLLIDKPAGITSHDAVAAVRRAVGVRRVGHSGTLD